VREIEIKIEGDRNSNDSKICDQRADVAFFVNAEIGWVRAFALPR
jgi:hypothetical protein